MTAECLGLEYNMIECDLFKGENRTEEYLKLNIQHSIPTIVDGKTVLNESRAAAAYLVNKYGKDDKLYVSFSLTVQYSVFIDFSVFGVFGDFVSF